MGYYRKKPVVIEAFQWTGGPDQTEDPEWIVDAMREGKVTITSYQNTMMHIETLEGVMTANVGDYIIKGVKGEIYPCKPDIFEVTYDKVEIHNTGNAEASRTEIESPTFYNNSKWTE